MTAEQREQRASRPRRPTAADGLLVIDKPAGWTSHDVVAKARWLAGTRKVGHAGTLDPMATGVLVLGIGRATRLLTYVVGAEKEYLATIRLGVSTSTDDAEGEVTGRTDVGVHPWPELQVRLADAVAELTGDIQQVPSSVSAIKVDGQRAYARVRAGEDVQLAARPVTVHAFEVNDQQVVPDADGSGLMAWDLSVRVVCSSGTYIRALARDLGERLGVGGHLTMLRRSRVGGYPLSEARSMAELEAWPVDIPLDTLPLADAARATFPVRDLTAEEARALGHGQRIAPSGVDGSERTVAALGPDGVLVALIEDRGPQAWPVLVFSGS
ncbi:tRNA pseudouridine(55) synthase TruB [Cellulomonas sp. NPDC089187]|uniref:tRNA pseudouridine(55) synthase TruB n=1 Tax=Cellulomonas sp. NPDC089187 TaxID=3154970 RepID=UPI00342A4462